MKSTRLFVVGNIFSLHEKRENTFEGSGNSKFKLSSSSVHGNKGCILGFNFDLFVVIKNCMP